MKTSIYLAAIAASGALAKPHGHHHRRSLHSHHAKRAVTEETTVVTVTVCKLGALELPESICDYYVNKGVLRYVDGGSIELASSAAPVFTPVPTSIAQKPSATPKAAIASPPQVEDIAPSPKPAVVDASMRDPQQQSSAAPAPIPPPQAVRFSASTNALANVNIPFVDGTVSCGSPPVQFGADPNAVQYLGGDGWLNSQVGRMTPNGIAGLANAKGCQQASSDEQIVMCQYNCPAGYVSNQFSNTARWQGINGESVGGLRCGTDNMLYRVRQDVDTICEAESEKVTVEVENRFSQDLYVCKTNYPGDEAMTIPFLIPAGQTVRLPVSDSETGFKTREGRATTNQFYLNEPGVPVEGACVWGNAGTKQGNWATMNIGAGISGSQPGYMSLFTNYPTQNAGTYPGKVRVEGTGVAPSTGCYYDGVAGTLLFNGETKSTVNQANSVGCTVAVNQGGTLRYIVEP